MRAKQLLKFVVFAIALVAMFISCSPSETAGTGAGNPAVVSLAVEIDRESSGPLAGPAKMGSSDKKTSLPVEIEDENGVVVSVTEAKLVARRILFEFSSTVQIMGLEPPLIAGADGIRLEGPIVFDAFTGQADPPLDDLHLPAGEYTSIKFMIGPAPGSADPSVEMKGAIHYGDVEHPFSLSLRINRTVYYDADAVLTLVPKHVTNLVVLLSPAEWLREAPIGECLSSGKLDLQPDGSVVLDEANGQGICNSIAATIGRNFVDFGKLKER